MRGGFWRYSRPADGALPSVRCGRDGPHRHPAGRIAGRARRRTPHEARLSATVPLRCPAAAPAAWCVSTRLHTLKSRTCAAIGGGFRGPCNASSRTTRLAEFPQKTCRPLAALVSSRPIQSPYPGLRLRFSSPRGLITFAAIGVVLLLRLQRRETDEIFLSHSTFKYPYHSHSKPLPSSANSQKLPTPSVILKVGGGQKNVPTETRSSNRERAAFPRRGHRSRPSPFQRKFDPSRVGQPQTSHHPSGRS